MAALNLTRKSPIEQLGEVAEHIARGDWRLLSVETMINHDTRVVTMHVKLSSLGREIEAEPEKPETPGLIAGIPVRDLDFE
jgi:hypothetical protein